MGWNMNKALLTLAEAEVCDKAAFLNLCAREGIFLDAAESMGEHSLRFRLLRRDYPAAERLAERCGGSVRLVRKSLGQRLQESICRRTLLFSLSGALAVLLLSSSLFVWELELGACPPDMEAWRIMAALDRAGLRKGSFVPALSPELLCSRAMESLPELSSLVVNIRGSRALVEARGRTSAPKAAEEGNECTVVAERSALLQELRVLSGTAALSSGTAVEKGTLLILPTPTAKHARGEAWGLCRVEKRALLPAGTLMETEEGKKKVIWGLQWGKRCIFLQRDSSISPMECGKIMRASSHALPLGLCSVTVWPVRPAAVSAELPCTRDAAERILRSALAQELGEEGELLTAAFTRSGQTLRLRCECRLRIDCEKEAE